MQRAWVCRQSQDTHSLPSDWSGRQHVAVMVAAAQTVDCVCKACHVFPPQDLAARYNTWLDAERCSIFFSFSFLTSSGDLGSMTSRSLARDRNISLRRELLLILRNSSRSSSSAMTILSAYIEKKSMSRYIFCLWDSSEESIDNEVSWSILKALERLRLGLSWADLSHAHTP